jgi:hypothetical protein
VTLWCCVLSRVTGNGPEPSKERFFDRFFDCRSVRRKKTAPKNVSSLSAQKKSAHKNEEIRKKVNKLIYKI